MKNYENYEPYVFLLWFKLGESNALKYTDYKALNLEWVIEDIVYSRFLNINKYFTTSFPQRTSI